MLEARIQQHFFDSADLLNQSAEPLARALSQAVQAVVACLTAGNKLVACGPDGAGALATHLAHVFLTGFERERPPLAAIAVADQGALTAVQQIHALGHPGDLLLTLALGAQSRNTRAVIEAAQDKDMTVIALTPLGDQSVIDLLRETDVLVALPSERAGRALELQLLALHCLCDAVDTQLLGEQIA